MSEHPAPGSRPLTLVQLHLLNEEIVALVRAGFPLEMGLRHMGDVRGTLRRVADELATRMEAGDDLAQALAVNSARVPRVYRAVVEAGLRSGNLAAALESLGTFVQTLLEFRRRMSLALLYPLIVIILAYGLGMGLLWEFLPRMAEFYSDFRLPMHGSIAVLLNARSALAYWAAIPPVVLLLFCVSWNRGGRALTLGGSATAALWMVPYARSILHQIHWAAFSELLALLVEHHVPLPSALPLAADATGDSRILSAAQKLAEAQVRGTPWKESVVYSGFPPLLRWYLCAPAGETGLIEALRQASQNYRRRAAVRLQWATVQIPLLLVTVVGGGATLLYSLALFAPLIELLRDLSTEYPM
jgi:general secretion pathway protein F